VAVIDWSKKATQGVKLLYWFSSMARKNVGGEVGRREEVAAAESTCPKGSVSTGRTTSFSFALLLRTWAITRSTHAKHWASISCVSVVAASSLAASPSTPWS